MLSALLASVASKDNVFVTILAQFANVWSWPG